MWRFMGDLPLMLGRSGQGGGSEVYWILSNSGRLVPHRLIYPLSSLPVYGWPVIATMSNYQI
jgi:hypothetical protein